MLIIILDLCFLDLPLCFYLPYDENRNKGGEWSSSTGSEVHQICQGNIHMYPQMSGISQVAL